MKTDWYNMIAKKKGGYKSNAIYEVEGISGEQVFEDKLIALLKKSHNVLDAGCGDGNFTRKMSRYCQTLTGFDNKKKNWLFSGSPKGAEASAGIYTLVETAKANGLAPMKYIKYILSDMPGSAFLEHPEYLDDYLPWNPLVKEFCR